MLSSKSAGSFLLIDAIQTFHHFLSKVQAFYSVFN
jgi:hypothetical protein